MPAGLSVAQINISVTADTSDADGKLAATGEKVESFASKTNQATSSTKDFTAASGLMATGAVGIAAGLAASAMAAGDFQASINEIGVVTGATADELQGLSDLALKIGKDTAFSAQEGAAAITELGKAGIGITDIMSGAAEATAALAGAGGVDMARAAQVMSAAMNIFQIEGSKSAEVADILAAGANASASSVDDLANGFSNAGPAAAALGMDLDDTVAVLALLADRGLSGAEAGTQLRGVLTSLTPKTKPAVEAFAELGLAVGESGNAFFDASGKFVGMEQASATLYDALKDLTDQQRAQALETIFGTYNAGAAETMFQAQKAAVEGTGKGYADYNKEVQAAGQATDVANAKMDGMNGAIMALQGSIETAQIVIGMQFVGAIEAAAEFLSTLVNAFLALPEPVQTAIAGVAAGAAAFLAVGSAVGFMIGPLGAAAAALAPVAVGIGAILVPLGLLVAGFFALKQAYDQNLGGFADAVNQAASDIVSALQPVIGLFQTLAIQLGSGDFSGALKTFTDGLPILGKAIGDVAGIIGDLAARAIPALINAFKSIDWSAVGDAIGSGLQTALATLSNFGAWVLNALQGGAGGGGGAGSFVGELTQWIADRFSEIDWGQIGAALLSGAQRAAALLLDFGQWGLDRLSELGLWLINAIAAVDWGGVSAALQSGLQQASDAFQTWFGAISQNLQTWFTSIDWGVIGGMLSTGLQTAIAAMGDVAGMLATKGAELISGLSAGFAQAWPTVAAWLGTVPALIGAAIAGAGSLAEILVAKGAELIGGLAAGFAQKWPEVSAWLSQVPTLIGAAIAAAGDVGLLLLQKGVDLIGGLLAGFIQKWPDISSWLGNLAGLIGTAVTISTDLLLQKGVDLITGLLTGLQQKWPEVQTWIGTAFTELGPTITTAMATVTTAASAAWDTMKTDATTKIEELKTEVLGKWDTLRTEIVNKVTDLQTTLASTFDSLKVDIPAKVTELVTNATTQFETLKTDATAKMTELQTSVTDAIETLKTQAIAKVEELQTSATESFTSLKTEAVQLITDLGLEALAQFEILKTNAIAKVEELKTGFVNKLNEMKTEAITAVTGIKDGIIAVFADAGTWLVSAGQAIGQGLINGLGSMKDAVGNAAGELGANATSAVTGLLGIRSPSKVFHEIGVDTAQGFANGIEAGEGAVAQAVAALIERITGVVADRLGALNGDLSEGGRRAGKSVVDGMNDATGDISDYEVGSAEWRQALQNKITAGMDKVGKKVGDDVNTGVKSKKADHQKAMGEFLDAGVNYGLDKADDATDIGVKAANAMRQGLTSGQQDLVTTSGKIATQVIDEFGDRVQAMYDIGKNYMEGFALGMRAGAAEVEEAANDIGKSAEKELRKATESQSPSKAAHRVGEDVGRGFADGISSTEDLSRKAARKLWRAAWKELKDSIKEGGFLGRDWALEFWEGMLNSPDMTGPLAAWITDQMVAAADTALKKIRAEIAGIAAQLDIARAAVGTTTIPEVPRPEPVEQPNVPRPEPVDTTQRDMLQEQLEATRELTDAIEKAFTQAFSEAHKAHIKFAQGVISEEEYLAKYQAAQSAYNAKKANADKIKSLEAQIKTLEKAMDAETKRREAAYQAQLAAAQAAYDAEVAARQKAYEEAVKARDAAVAAELQAQKDLVAQLEQAQRDAQMAMTKAVIDESNQRIAQYEKELRKATDPRERAELKAKIALEKERIEVANQLAGAITAANNATNDFDLSVANAQIDYFTAQLEALGQVDVGGMLQGIADAMLEAANKIAQAADKMKNAFRGGGKGKGEKDKGGATQDASDPSLGGGMGAAADGGGVSQEFDKIGKAARKAGDDVNAGMGVADMAIRKVLGTTLPAYVKGMGDAGTKGGEALGKNASVAIEHGEASMSKTIVKSVEGATLNGVKIGADRGKEIGVTVTTNMETGVKSREREVTKTVDGVVKDSTDAAVPTAEKGGTKIGDGFITFTSRSITQGQGKVAGDAKQMMTHAGQEAQQEAQRTGKSAGTDFSKFTAQGVKQGERDVRRAGKDIMDGAGQEAKRDANRLGRQAGDDLGRGVAEGIRGRINDVRQAAKDLADAANSGGGGGGGGGGNGGGGGGNGGGGGGGGHRRDAVVEAQQLGTRVGDAMATGVADGVRAQTRSAELAAVDLVQATNQAARKAAQAHSPSKLFMRLGNDIGDGLVIGLHDRKGDAQDAAHALIYTPKGLPGGRSGNSNGAGGPASGDTTIVINNPTFPNVVHPEDFWPAIQNMVRTNGVTLGRG